MSVILGIDAAWTEKHPSGVALVKGCLQDWHCIAIAPSYESFVDIAANKQVDWNRGLFKSSHLNVSALIGAAEKLAGESVDIVAIDMPISKDKITARRQADSSLSEDFGRFQAAVHSPSESIPGKHGERITKDFSHHGFEVSTTEGGSDSKKPLLEVYPHAALIRLLELNTRLKYKVAKSKKYWPNLSKENRMEFLMQNILAAYNVLNTFIKPTNPHGDIVFPAKPENFSHLKSIEDSLDALVCAWVGICHLNSKTTPYGDINAAIWVPTHETSATTKSIQIKE